VCRLRSVVAGVAARKRELHEPRVPVYDAGMGQSGLCVLESVRFEKSVWDLPRAHVDALRARFPDVTFLSPAARADVDGLVPGADVVLGGAVTRDNFAAARRLRWVHATSAGVAAQLFPAFVDSDVTLTNSRGLHADAMAEHTLGAMLAFARQLHLARDAQRAGRWDQEAMWLRGFGGLAGTTMVLVGLGAVGGAIAARARAFGVRVVAVRRHPQADVAPADEQHPPEALASLLPRADWLVLAAPLTAATRQLVGAAELARLPRTAMLVNIGRGRLVDEAALVAALRSGALAGAALDVMEEEPLPESSELWSLPNVVLTPHVSGFGPRYWERMMAIFTDNLERFLAGQPLRNVVDKRAGY
jgi:phosphoglycerate dehydrogenase-like enzyme